MKPLLISSGEPAGIGPDVCLALAKKGTTAVVMGDLELLHQRAKQLRLRVEFMPYESGKPVSGKPNQLTVLALSCKNTVKAGELDPANSAYVMEMLSEGVVRCLSREFSGFITAPVHKAVINQAGIPFSGHTEFLAERCQVKTVVMMLASRQMKVALVTTHLPLKAVPLAITHDKLTDVLRCLHSECQKKFGLDAPRLVVAGLNPHAGEEGYLGDEEIKVITPVLNELRTNEKMNLTGPVSADTMYTAYQPDVFVAMYHDQGLPVIKQASFGRAVNITLGLPIIRVSVDHGTALALAGTGRADPGSMETAIEVATHMARCFRG